MKRLEYNRTDIFYDAEGYAITMMEAVSGRFTNDIATDNRYHLFCPMYQRKFEPSKDALEKMIGDFETIHFDKNGDAIDKKKLPFFGTIGIKKGKNETVHIVDAHHREYKVSIYLVGMLKTCINNGLSDYADYIKNILTFKNGTPVLRTAYISDDDVYRKIIDSALNPLCYHTQLDESGSNIVKYYDDVIKEIKKNIADKKKEDVESFIWKRLRQIQSCKAFVFDIGDSDEYTCFDYLNKKYNIAYSAFDRIGAYLYYDLDESVCNIEQQNQYYKNYWVKINTNISKSEKYSTSVCEAAFLKDAIVALAKTDRPTLNGGPRKTANLNNNDDEGLSNAIINIIKNNARKMCDENPKISSSVALTKAKIQMMIDLTEYSEVFCNIIPLK